MGACSSTSDEPGLQSKGLQSPCFMLILAACVVCLVGASFVSDTSDVIDRLEASLSLKEFFCWLSALQAADGQHNLVVVASRNVNSEDPVWSKCSCKRRNALVKMRTAFAA